MNSSLAASRRGTEIRRLRHPILNGSRRWSCGSSRPKRPTREKRLGQGHRLLLVLLLLLQTSPPSRCPILLREQKQNSRHTLIRHSQGSSRHKKCYRSSRQQLHPSLYFDHQWRAPLLPGKDRSPMEANQIVGKAIPVKKEWSMKMGSQERSWPTQTPFQHHD